MCTVSATSPKEYLPPTLTQQLVDSLNGKKIDLYQFVREMRFGFCVEIELEKRLGPKNGGVNMEGTEDSREREREKIRREAEPR
jgi:hypothetical protein